MTFTCEIGEECNNNAFDLEAEENLFRFEVNDSYLAYTSSSSTNTPNKK